MLTDGKVKKLTIARINADATPRRIDFGIRHRMSMLAILYFTGSKAFNVVMRKRALSLDLTLNEHGLSEMKNKKKGEKLPNKFLDEKSYSDFLSLEYKKPEEKKDGNSVIVNEDIKNVEEAKPKKLYN